MYVLMYMQCLSYVVIRYGRGLLRQMNDALVLSRVCGMWHVRFDCYQHIHSGRRPQLWAVDTRDHELIGLHMNWTELVLVMVVEFTSTM